MTGESSTRDRLDELMVSEHGLVFDPRTGEQFQLNASGLEIWRLLGEGLTLGEVSAQLVQRYGIEPERAAGAVSRLVAALRDAGLARLRE